MAKTVKLKALKGCPYRTEGEVFMATSSDAKALVALQKAEVIHADQKYSTRDMGNSPQNREMKGGNAKKNTEKSAADSVQASPDAQKLAEEHKVDLSKIKGTGKNGRIVKADVQNALKSA
jgi:pyruvate/2-oxoglutarate dehydrogenase complex dihydrolipoamide acyltransferase (E2) component